MDFGRLIFESPAVGDADLPTSDFGFYGAFLPDHVDVHDVHDVHNVHDIHGLHGLTPLPGDLYLAENGAVLSYSLSAGANAVAATSAIMPSTRAYTYQARAATPRLAGRQPVQLRAKAASRKASVAGPVAAPLPPPPPPGDVSDADRPSKLERRGHTKSRRGCFNCKRRRIKCQESRPACGHCVKTGLQCEYPSTPLVHHQPQQQIPLFSLQDMRFFQHFLEHCRPHHPLGNESLWTHEIPSLSHQYDYLMHALLGMAASDLMRQDSSLAAAAMDHRLKAIRAIKRALATVSKRAPPCKASLEPAAASSSSSSSSSSPRDTSVAPISSSNNTPLFEEGNALMATCFALTFQSVELDDGMAEYMTFIRGILLVVIQMHVRGARLLFRNLLGSDQQELVRPALEPIAPIQRPWVETAVAAMQALTPLCQGDTVAAEYQALLLVMAKALVCPVEAYAAMTRHYAWWMQLPHKQFRRIVDLDRPVFVLLATHWIALKQIMARFTDVETAVSAQEQDMGAGVFRWLKHLNRQVNDGYRAYNAWPAWVEAQLDFDPQAFRRVEEADGEI